MPGRRQTGTQQKSTSPVVHVGLFPDVAFAYLSAKVGMPLPMALYLGLTGTRLSDPADLLATGLATHYVPSSKLGDLRKAILEASYGEDEGLLKGTRASCTLLRLLVCYMQQCQVLR